MGFLFWLGTIADTAGAIGGIVAGVGVIKMLVAQRRQAERVEVILQLQGADRSMTLPLELLRRDVSRAELLGRLGMLPMKAKGARFTIRHLSTPAFMQEINEIVGGKASMLVIPATEAELEQFDLDQ